MSPGSPSFYSLVALALLTVVLVVGALSRGRWRAPNYLRMLWVFALAFSAAELLSFTVAVWILAVFAFASLREYFSLVDIRLEDRWGLLAAFLCIPCVFYLIQIDWYGFFIVSIPVYAFLIIPFLVVLGGGEARGTIFSIGAISFGLFLFVYCMGHIAYLTRFSTWLGMLLVAGVALCDLVDRRYHPEGGRLGVALRKYLVAMPLPLAISALLGSLAGVPATHRIALGFLMPALVLMGNFTLAAIEDDLGIADGDMGPGKGRLFCGLKSYLFTAPVVFHYLRYATELF